MKESSGKTKKPSKGVRRARSMRNVVMMVLVCVLMLSAATYAWFSLSTAAKVAGLSMTVGEETSLLIAPDLNRDGDGIAGDYGSILAFDADLGPGIAKYKLNAPLLPATMSNEGVVYKPYYNKNDGTIIENFTVLESNSSEILKDSITEAVGDYYYYKTSFYLKTAGSEKVTVELKEPTKDSNMDANTAPANSVGTYIITETDKGMGAAAIRIRLTANNNAIVYEPMNDVNLDQNGKYESAKIQLASGASTPTAISSTDVQKSDGTFTQHSGTLEVTPDGVRVTMEIWLEGSDPQCVNQIMGDVIKGQIAFAVKETTTP